MGRSNVMFSFQSAFHPVFWMHHNNIDRFCKLLTGPLDLDPSF